MTPTTVPAPTRTPYEYLADAIADHYWRHGADRAKTAAFELAVTLTETLGLTPAHANAVTDALDRLAWGGLPSAAARPAAPPSSPPGRSSTSIAEANVGHDTGGSGCCADETDDAPAPAIAPGRYRVTFLPGIGGMARVGRTYNVPPVEAYADEIADAVYRVARPLLLSGAVGVHVNPGLTPTDGTVTVFAGYQTAATATYERIGDDDRPSEARL